MGVLFVVLMCKHDMYIPHNILVTGGCGFIGSHVLCLMVKKYPHYNFVNFDCLDYCANVKNVEEIQDCSNYKFVKGNILSLDYITYVLKTENIDTIMHFAAQSHVDNSFGNSLHFTQTNVLGTHTILEAARVNNIKRFIHVSTDEVYGEVAYEDNAATEEKVLEPTNPYAASKAAAEFIVKSYLRCWDLPVIITRGNNVYGPRQYPEKIIPKFIHRLSRGLPCCIHGDGSNKRTYIYVEDVARAFDTILHYGTVGTIYNIAKDEELSNIEVANHLISLFGHTDPSKYLNFVSDRKINDRRYNICTNKMEQLGWSPRVPWDVGIRLTLEWNQNNLNYFGNIDSVLSPHPTVVQVVE